jgi:phage anti-repressor protein
VVGKHALFNGREYIVIHEYTSGNCEIKDISRPYQIELVHSTEIKLLKKDNKSIVIES